MSLFDILPDELIHIFMNYLDCKHIFLFENFSEKFRRIFPSLIELIRKKISYQTGLYNIGSYNMKKLRELSVFRCNRNICTDGDHMLFIRNKQSYSVGYNNYGQLGLGDKHSRSVPELVPLDNVVQVAANTTQSIWLTSKGLVYGSGVRIYDNDFMFYPNAISGINNIVSVAMRDESSLLLNSNGEVYAFNNKFGKKQNYKLIPGLKNIISITTSSSHALALRSDGRVYAFGSNTYGQLGLGRLESFELDHLKKLFPDIPDEHLVYFNKTSCSKSFMLIPNLENVVQIAVGEFFSLALTSDKKVYKFGLKYEKSSYISKIRHIFVPKLIPDMTNIVSISAKHQNSLLLTEDGNVHRFFCGDSGHHKYKSLTPDNLFSELKNIVQISAGMNTSLALDTTGNIYLLGNNSRNIEIKDFQI